MMNSPLATASKSPSLPWNLDFYFKLFLMQGHYFIVFPFLQQFCNPNFNTYRKTDTKEMELTGSDDDLHIGL